MKGKRKISFAGSMSLEASIALPLFIFFFINIMSAIWIIQIQSELEAALHQTGSEVAGLAFDIREGKEVLSGLVSDGREESLFAEDNEGCKEVLSPDDNKNGDVLEMAAFRTYTVSRIKSSMEKTLRNNPVVSGADSLRFTSSKILQDGDIVDIVVDYKVHPIIGLIGFNGFDVQSRFYGHAWTGYDVSLGAECEDCEEELVYITEHGEVYHRDISCRYLKSGVRSISFDSLSHERNADRKKYYPCEYCGGNISGGNVFVTEYGTRYHQRTDCQGLKRKIYTVPISEVGGKRPCSACGG